MEKTCSVHELAVHEVSSIWKKEEVENKHIGLSCEVEGSTEQRARRQRHPSTNILQGCIHLGGWSSEFTQL